MAKRKLNKNKKSVAHGKRLGKTKNLNCSLYHGDCLDRLKSLPSKSIDLAIIDPPYLFNKGDGGGAFGAKNRKHLRDIAPLGDGFDFSVLDELERVLKNTNLYIFCNQKLLTELIVHYQAKDVSLNILCWHKSNPMPACGNKYLDDVEYVLFVRGNGVKIYGNYHTKSKVYKSSTNKKDKDLYGHPTPKPVPLLENYIQNSSQLGDTVIDCFMGSGSTGVASLNVGRHFIGVELDPAYFQTAKKRITGKSEKSKEDCG